MGPSCVQAVLSFFLRYPSTTGILQLNIFMMCMVAPGGDKPGDEHGSRGLLARALRVFFPLPGGSAIKVSSL